jgi:hypothetical protein
MAMCYITLTTSRVPNHHQPIIESFVYVIISYYYSNIMRHYVDCFPFLYPSPYHVCVHDRHNHIATMAFRATVRAARVNPYSFRPSTISSSLPPLRSCTAR